jgi:hypothetical protein
MSDCQGKLGNKGSSRLAVLLVVATSLAVVSATIHWLPTPQADKQVCQQQKTSVNHNVLRAGPPEEDLQIQKRRSQAS